MICKVGEYNYFLFLFQNKDSKAAAASASSKQQNMESGFFFFFLLVERTKRNETAFD